MDKNQFQNKNFTPNKNQFQNQNQFQNKNQNQFQNKNFNQNQNQNQNQNKFQNQNQNNQNQNNQNQLKKKNQFINQNDNVYNTPPRSNRRNFSNAFSVIESPFKKSMIKIEDENLPSVELPNYKQSDTTLIMISKELYKMGSNGEVNEEKDENHEQRNNNKDLTNQEDTGAADYWVLKFDHKSPGYIDGSLGVSFFDTKVSDWCVTTSLSYVKGKYSLYVKPDGKMKEWLMNANKEIKNKLPLSLPFCMNSLIDDAFVITLKSNPEANRETFDYITLIYDDFISIPNQSQMKKIKTKKMQKASDPTSFIFDENLYKRETFKIKINRDPTSKYYTKITLVKETAKPGIFAKIRDVDSNENLKIIFKGQTKISPIFKLRIVSRGGKEPKIWVPIDGVLIRVIQNQNKVNYVADSENFITEPEPLVVKKEQDQIILKTEQPSQQTQEKQQPEKQQQPENNQQQNNQQPPQENLQIDCNQFFEEDENEQIESPTLESVIIAGMVSKTNQEKN